MNDSVLFDMVSASLNLASFVGIFCFIFGFWIYIKERKLRLDGVLLNTSGLYFFFQGWRLNPVQQFAYILIMAVIIFLSYRSYVKSAMKLLYNSFAKDNRTAVAIAIGAIAIVLAILFSNNQPKNADNNKDSRPEVVRAVERDIGYGPYYECPSGYDGRGGWCYLK